MSTNTIVRGGLDRVIRRGDAGYDALRSGFNIAIEHRPEWIVEAIGPDDVVAAVRLAVEVGRPVAVMNTGHGPSVTAERAVLIRVGRMNRVEVDPVRRTARIEGGAAWRDVIEATTPYGLAPLNGSSPHVGAVGYTLGGGIGLLARRFGFAADHVRALDVVTADGRSRQVTADCDPELFGRCVALAPTSVWSRQWRSTCSRCRTCWAVSFAEEAREEVLHTYAGWAAAVPETMASSVLLLDYPDDPAVPPRLRGRHITHLRIAFTGDDHADGHRWVRTLRRISRRVVDTVRVMPYAEIGTIHHEPTDVPVPAFDRNILLADFDQDAAATLAKHAGPGAGFLTELRAWGGALARPPVVPNAVGGRDAAFSLLAISDPSAENRARRDGLLAAMRPWANGAIYPNFAGVEDTSVDAVRRGYRPEDFARLRKLKATYDPGNVFRVNFNIPPEGSTS
jgi:FAD/FMN-containing dehydrogenase